LLPKDLHHPDGGTRAGPSFLALERRMSLVTTPVRALPTCGACASTRVTSITMTLTDGSVVDFASCHACERKSWRQEGRELDIATVLGKTRKLKAA
jgi:predicted metal-binding protein